MVAYGSTKDATAQVSITVSGPTIITSSLPNADVGEPYYYQIFVSQSATGMDATGLPPGLTINSQTGQLSGTSTAVGTFSIRFAAHTAYGDAIKTIRLVVQAPRLTSTPIGPAIEVADVYSYQTGFTGHPTSFGASGLPDGLQIDPVTGVISGVPTLSGVYQVTLTAITPYGTASGMIVIQVIPAIPGEPTIARFPITSVNSMVADPHRSRVYVATSSSAEGRLQTLSCARLTLPSKFRHTWCADRSDAGSSRWQRRCARAG